MKDADKLLERCLATVMRKGRVHIPVRATHHWRGRRFITRKKLLPGGFNAVMQHVSTELAIGSTAMFTFHNGDFGLLSTADAYSHRS